MDLYFACRKGLCRINLKEFSKETRPPMEKVVDFLEQGLPAGMASFSLNSKVYMVGGEKIRKGEKITFFVDRASKLDTSDGGNGLNSQVFVFDPSDPDSPCKPTQDIVPMHGGKTNPIVAKIGQKVYILSGPAYCARGPIVNPSFECYDPSLNSWEALETPPFYRDTPDRRYHMLTHFVLGEEFFATIYPIYHVYNVNSRKWIAGSSEESIEDLFPSSMLAGSSMDLIEDLFPFSMLGCSLAHVGNLAIAFTDEGLLAYRTDLQTCQLLNDLNSSFPRPDPYTSEGFICHLDDFRFCSALFFTDTSIPELYVSVFQVQMNCGDGNILDVVQQHTHVYRGASITAPMVDDLSYIFTASRSSTKRGSEFGELHSSFKKQKHA